MDGERAAKVLLAIDLVLGIAFLLFPRFSLRLYGLDPDAEPTAAYPIRYIGARSLLLAALMADAEGRPILVGKMPLIAATDAAVNGLALARGEVPRRVAVLGALTSAVAVGLGFASDR